MSETKNREMEMPEVLYRAQGFWEKYSKIIMIVGTVVIVLAGGYLGYRNFIQAPKEEKAKDEIFPAENFFKKDSLNLALNGQGTTPGFLRIISRFDGTPTANLARLYAGECYLRLGDFSKAVKYLKEFKPNGAKQVEAKTYGLLGDAYSELKQNDDAIAAYKKAGTTFETDEALSSEYLFRAGLLLEMSGKKNEAAEVYQQVKDKYPKTEKGFVVEKYLARLGVSQSE